MRGRATALLQRAAATATATATASATAPTLAPSAATAAITTAAASTSAAARATAPLLALQPQLLRGLGVVGPSSQTLPPPPPVAVAGGADDADSNNSSSSQSTSSRRPTGPALSAAATAASIAPLRPSYSGAAPATFSRSRAYSSAAAAVAAPAAASASAASAPVPHDDGPDNDPSPLVAQARRDPFALVADEVAAVGERMRRTVATEVPALADAALYFLRPGVTGKRLRPTLLLLMAGALEGNGVEGGVASSSASTADKDDPLSVDLRAPHEPCGAHETRRRQQRVAEVAELIHVASLLHDDVLDEASTRRGVPALHAAAAVAATAAAASPSSSSSSSSSRRADKLAILAGDFLLARASVTLAALGDSRVVALLSRVLEHLVSGEVMQMSARGEQLASPAHYLRKTYAKTASLMANSCRAVALIGGAEGGGDLAFEAARGGDGLAEGGEGESGRSGDVWGEEDDEEGGAGGRGNRHTFGPAPLAPADAAWAYGRHLGMAFQVVDDLLDLTGAPGVLGKPTLSDLRAGLATAPVLMAAEEDATRELRALATARFSGGERDVARAVELVARTRGVERAWALARRHADAAAAAVRALPPARTEKARAHRAALVALTRRVLERRK